MPNLIILAGIPGSGKSTWARNFFDLKYQIVSSDDIRKELFGGLKVAHEPEVKAKNNATVFDLYHQRIIRALEHNVDVIADATNLSHTARERLCKIAEECGAKVHLVLFKNILDATQRNLAREEDHQVPREAMEFMVAKYWDSLARIPQEKYETVTKVEKFS